MDFGFVQLNIKQEPPVEFDCDYLPDEDLPEKYTEIKVEESHQEQPKKFQCKKCGKAYRRKTHLERHEHIHNSIFECIHCGMVFHHPIIFDLHLNKFHRESQSNVENPKHLPGTDCNQDSKQLVHQRKHETTQVSFECVICGMAYERLEGLKAHLKNHPDIVQKPEQIQSSYQYDSTKVFACNQCGLRYMNLSGWQKHIKTHLKPTHKCLECGMMFGRSGHLKDHRRTHIAIQNHMLLQPLQTQVELPLKCKFCGITSTTRTNHNRHIRLHVDYGIDTPLLSDHTLVLKTPKPLKPFTCAHCGQQFLRKYSWRRHTDAHEKPKRYKCDECGKRFQMPFNLKEHQLLHSERKYKCDICNRFMRHKSTLKQHIQIHATKLRNTSSV